MPLLCLSHDRRGKPHRAMPEMLVCEHNYEIDDGGKISCWCHACLHYIHIQFSVRLTSWMCDVYCIATPRVCPISPRPIAATIMCVRVCV